jgi:hypothetical protein
MGLVGGIRGAKRSALAQPPRFEVTASAPSSTELKALGSKSPALVRTVRQARLAFADLLAGGGKLFVFASAANGGQPVLTIRGPGFDPKLPAKVQTHYHGDRTSVAEENGHTTQAIEQLIAADPQRVFVLPEARANVNAEKTDWTNVLDQPQTTREALSAAAISLVGERTVSAHSSGGRALAKALEKPIEADRVLCLDCLYEPAMSMLKKGLKKNGKSMKELVVVRGTNERGRWRTMVDAFAPSSRGFEVGALGDNPHEAVVRYYLDGRGGYGGQPQK